MKALFAIERGTSQIDAIESGQCVRPVASYSFAGRLKLKGGNMERAVDANERAA